jgi:hypothetical protein
MQGLPMNPYRKQREGLTIQGMGRINDRDLTTDLEGVS